MGVRHLEYFLKHNVPDGFVNVSIIEECQKYQKKSNGKKPTIVIDLQNMGSLLNKDKAEMLFGGRSGKNWKMLDDFFRLLSSVATLVFFADGPVVETKYDTWVQRQNAKYLNYQKIFDLIYKKFPMNAIVKSLEEQIPGACFHHDILKVLAKVYGTLTVAVTAECDAEIAKYASENLSVIAVMADDSDYLIFPGHWRYFSIRELNLKELTTKEFSRTALRKYLKLNDSQMKLLATIAGNDVIKYDEVRSVHEREKFGHQASFKFPAIANMIRFDVGEDSFEDILYKLAKFLLKDRSNSAQERIRKSIDWYNIQFNPVDLNDHNDNSEESKLLRFCRSNSFNHVYSLLRDLPKNLTLTYYDFRTDDWPTAGTVTQDIYSRQIGIILKYRQRGQKNSNPAAFSSVIYTKCSKNEGYQKYSVTPSFPDYDVPPVIKLLDHEGFPELDENRFKLMKWSISDTLTNVDLRNIPGSYLRNVLSLYLMVEKKFISVREADILLLTVLNVEKKNIPDDLKHPPVVDERAFKLVFFFFRIFSVIGRSIKTVGLKRLCELLSFDGVFFHKMYPVYMKAENDPAPLLMEIDHYRIYKNL